MSLFIPPKPKIVPNWMKAGPIGQGAGVLMTEFSLDRLGRNTVQEKMRKAIKMGITVPWIRDAERVISGNCSTVEWMLKDQNDEEIDDEYKGGLEQEARLLIEKPQAMLTKGKKLTRREMWALTFRHMGLAGNAFWFLDAMNTYGIPTSILYIRPDRMTPVDDENGNLTGWLLDQDLAHGLKGTPIDLQEVVQFVLDPPDEGHFGVGLVESALLKANLSTATDQHMAQVLSAGGRVSGIMTPKDGTIGDTTYQQMVADWRGVVEQPEAAKRLQIVRAPVDFISTSLTPAELHIRDVMNGARDDLLAIWGVPLSQVGGSPPSGMNSGETRKYDEAALWQNANHPRLVAFSESVQMGLLDRYADAGAVVDLEIDEPEFDDDAPRYDLLQKSVNTPLRNSERRSIVGLEPFGPLILGTSGTPLDDEVWMPVTMALAFTANEAGNDEPEPQQPTDLGFEGGAVDNAQAGELAGETSQPGNTAVSGVPSTKASLNGPQTRLHTKLTKLRANIDKSQTPKLKRSVAQVLKDQRSEIASRLREHAAAIKRKPSDTTVWWNGPKWDKALSKALAGGLRGTAETVNATLKEMLPEQKAGLNAPAVERVMTRGAARVTRINETTRDKVKEAIARAIDEGMTANDAADAVEGITDSVGGLNLGSLFDEYRSEMIARTELMDAYNATALATYSDAGVGQVEAIDGDQDEECADRDGQTFDVDEADTIEDHPNGTLDWVPIIPDDQPQEDEQKATLMGPVKPADVLAFAQAHSQTAADMVGHLTALQVAQLHSENDRQNAAQLANLADALRNQPPAVHPVAAPIVNIAAPEPDVHTIQVAAPDMQPVTDAITAQTEALRQRPTVKTVIRDNQQRIASVVESPLDVTDADPTQAD